MLSPKLLQGSGLLSKQAQVKHSLKETFNHHPLQVPCPFQAQWVYGLQTVCLPPCIPEAHLGEAGFISLIAVSPVKMG